MRLLIPLIVFLILQNKVVGQQLKFDPFTNKLILFKTADDFFEKKNGICYTVLEISGSKLKCVDTITKKKYKINLLDSNYFGFNMSGYGNTSMRYIKLNKAYYTFAGGTKAFCFVITYDINNGYYNADGYLSGFTIFDPGSLNVYYVKEANEKTANADFSLVGNDKKELADKFKNEKKETESRIWQRNLINIAAKYTKLYNAQ